MGEFFIRIATAADVDRLWPLFDEVDEGRRMVADDATLELAELRRSALVAILLDRSRPVLVAYSGVRAVGYLFATGDEAPYVSESWRGLGVELELDEARSAYRRRDPRTGQ